MLQVNKITPFRNADSKKIIIYIIDNYGSQLANQFNCEFW